MRVTRAASISLAPHLETTTPVPIPPTRRALVARHRRWCASTTTRQPTPFRQVRPQPGCLSLPSHFRTCAVTHRPFAFNASAASASHSLVALALACSASELFHHTLKAVVEFSPSYIPHIPSSLTLCILTLLVCRCPVWRAGLNSPSFLKMRDALSSARSPLGNLSNVSLDASS